jgi:hypothetical protein
MAQVQVQQDRIDGEREDFDREHEEFTESQVRDDVDRLRTHAYKLRRNNPGSISHDLAAHSIEEACEIIEKLAAPAKRKRSDPMFHGVVGIVEATSFEKLCLWQGVQKEQGSWEQNLSGSLVTVGKVGELPVCVSIFIDKVKGHKIVFWHATSQVVDYDMIETWFNDNLPQTAFRPGTSYVNSVDSMNFHNVFPR